MEEKLHDLKMMSLIVSMDALIERFVELNQKMLIFLSKMQALRGKK